LAYRSAVIVTAMLGLSLVAPAGSSHAKPLLDFRARRNAAAGSEPLDVHLLCGTSTGDAASRGSMS
jgi:hypothetical protein